MGAEVWAYGLDSGEKAVRCMNFRTPGAVERSCQNGMGDRIWGPRTGFLAICREAFSGRQGWSCAGPPWSSYNWALLCPEPAPIGGERASLAARPDGQWLKAQRNPKTRIQDPRVIFRKMEQGQRPPAVLPTEEDDRMLV